MEHRTWTSVVDKSGWAPGPWQDEPDKEQWADPATGLPCLLKRNPRSGSLCGYVGIPEGHPWYAVPYDDVPVWGAGRELTYSGLCEPGPEDRTICHVPAPGEPDRVWWLGFHTADVCRDVMPGQDATDVADGIPPFRMGDEVYRDVAYVKNVCTALAAVVAAVGALAV